MQSHIGCICLLFLHCVFSNYLLKGMQGYTGCILLTFIHVHFQMCPQIACPRECIVALAAFVLTFSPQCVFKWILKWFAPDISNVSSNYITQKRHIHISCIYFAFLHCVFSNVSSMHLHKKIHSHIGCNDLFIHCGILCVSSNCLHEKVHSHIGCNWLHCYAFLLLCICKAAVELWKNLSGKIV